MIGDFVVSAWERIFGGDNRNVVTEPVDAPAPTLSPLALAALAAVALWWLS